MTRTEIQLHMRRLAGFKDAIIHADRVHRRRELIGALRAEQQIVYELWRTMPDDRKKQLQASNRRIRQAIERCLLFKVPE